MKPRDIFTIKTPNGVEIKAVIVNVLSKEYNDYIAYSQNRLFIVRNTEGTELRFIKTVVNYCIIPELDDLLDTHIFFTL